MDIITLTQATRCSDCGAMIPAGQEARSYPGGKIYHRDTAVCRENKKRPAAPAPAPAARSARPRSSDLGVACLKLAEAFQELIQAIEEERNDR